MMVKNRIILHIDMDAFFAQVEERENPQFRDKPIVVGADPKEGQGRGVVSTANYQARKYGIKSALPISEAWRRCPAAIFLPVNMELYQKVSENIMKILRKFSKNIEKVSVDEAFLDISDCQGYEKAENLAKKIKKEVLEKERLTSTIGIGPNKLLAKIATNQAKPNGLLVIKPKQVEEFLELFNIQELPGIGPKTGEKLRRIRISKIKELKKLSRLELKNLFGKVGKKIYERARGIDKEPVKQEEIIKSIGKEYTFERDTRDSEIIFQKFDEIIKNVYQELVRNNFSFKTVTVVCRFSGFETYTKSKTLKMASKELEILKREAKKLLLKFLIDNQKLIRLIGLRVKLSD